MKASNKACRALKIQTRAIAAKLASTVTRAPAVSKARAAFTYRGMRSRLERGERECERLKRVRTESGVTRCEFDRYRWWLANKEIAPNWLNLHYGDESDH